MLALAASRWPRTSASCWSPTGGVASSSLISAARPYRSRSRPPSRSPTAPVAPTSWTTIRSTTAPTSTTALAPSRPRSGRSRPRSWTWCAMSSSARSRRSRPSSSRASGIDIDPVSDVAVLACGAPDPVPVLDLTTGTIRQTFPQITGADGMYFNNNTRRWYQANNSNTNPNADTCPVDTIDGGNLVPVVGVFGAAKGGGRAVSLIGVQCSVANGHSLGVDPIHNNVYVPGKAFPANGGPPGVAVFHDPSPSAQRPVNRAQADLQPLSGQIVQGQVTFQNQGRVVSASVKYISREAPSELVITTTVGNEVVRCADADPGRERDEGRNELAICQGLIIGAPLIRGVVLFGVAGKLFASGTIHRGAGEPDD